MNRPAFLRRRRRSDASRYAAGGANPPYAMDYARDKYRVDGARSTFDNAHTFARSGSATYVDSTGTLQTAADGEPRTGHHVWNGSEWVNEGLLLESESRTNLVLHSGDFSESVWTPSGATFTQNSGVVTLTDGEFAQTGITITGSTKFVFTLEIDKSSTGFIRTGVFQTGSLVNNLSGWFDCSTGAWDIAEANGDYSFFDSGVEDRGDFWFAYLVGSRATAGISGSLYIYNTDTSGSTTRSSTQTTTFKQPQVEVGPTPSSYIPTNGSTVTRAAETLTAPSANLPWWTDNIVYLSDELVTNGGFTNWTSDNPDGWSVYEDSGIDVTESSAGGQVRFVGDNTSATIWQPGILTPGKKYVIQVEMVESPGPGELAVSTNANDSGNAQLPFDSSKFINIGNNTYTLVAESDTFVIGRVSASGITIDATIDNISVREIETPAVSIAMEGLETYADEDTAGQVTLYDRRVDANNRITLTLDTDGAKTGTFTLTLVNGGSTETISTTGEITPGVNKPFNLSFVATSTELGIALNGTAETRVSHTLGLPDLSRADATYEGIGARTLVREWADDVDEAEASS